MHYRNPLARVVTACFFVQAICLAAPLPQPTASHEQPALDPWVPKPRSAIASSMQCAPIMRDGYASIQVNVDANGCNVLGDAANEPSITIDPSEPRKMAIGWRQFDDMSSDFRQAGWSYSHDGGHSWVFPGSLTPGEMGSDPVLASSDNGVFYFLSINIERMRFFRSFNAGIAWEEPIIVIDDFVDKPWMTVDRTGGLGDGHIYIVGSQSRFWRGTNNGSFFVQIPTGGGLGNFLSLSVAFDGALYLGDETSRVSKSINAVYATQDDEIISQRTQATPGFRSGQMGIEPNWGGLIGQGWVATDHSNAQTHGNLYYLASVLVPVSSIDVRFASSTDGGLTWSNSVRVNDDPPTDGLYHWFGMMSVAPNGRIDAVWNDTRNSGQGNLCELYYSFSEDAGDTWSPNVPVSPMFDSWVGWPAGQHKIGDYYHMLSDNLGVNVAYAATFNGEQDVYFLRIGPWDCNGNEIDDAADISTGVSKDCNANAVPDECEYRVDIDGDGLTTLEDHSQLATKLSGPSSPLLDKEGAGGGDCDQLFDANHDGHIDLADYAYLQRVLVSP